MRATVRRAELNTEIADRVAASIGRQPAKVIALRIGTSPRHVRGLQQREHGIGAAAFLLLCQDDAELRAWANQVMLAGPDSERGRAIIRQIERRLGEGGSA